ncbi:hypothetical protein [Hyphomonas oceanitis]|uniref:Uncharacterized protein n=1 Tax=Hyphomonas oceanitis SCH89 TaxID=1280953 RepID=A0A059G5N0_9PROT|nr:hypothetical protein [Hyphomonas oceanitis]KDA01773.1 hypothetical protein HOC_14083 [Hyphomonas oceanitis SCH89]
MVDLTCVITRGTCRLAPALLTKELKRGSSGISRPSTMIFGTMMFQPSPVYIRSGAMAKFMMSSHK